MVEWHTRIGMYDRVGMSKQKRTVKQIMKKSDRVHMMIRKKYFVSSRTHLVALKVSLFRTS